jgi:hypothetical protein
LQGVPISMVSPGNFYIRQTLELLLSSDTLN